MKFLLLLLIVSTKALAISEVNYAVDYAAKVKPFIEQMNKGEMYSNNLKISYRSYLNADAKSCLVILPGRSESAVKYAEFVYDLNQTAFGKSLNYFIMDHRGQGESARMTSKLDMGYVDHFSNYVSDLDNFLSSVVAKANCEKKFLFAHSMGAGIGLSYLKDHPEVFNAVAVSSPMLKIQTKPYSYAVARSIVTGMMAIGRGDEFAIGQKPFNSSDDFDTNRFTTSKARFAMTMQTFETYPTTKLGGVSNRWLYEIMRGTSKLRKSYAQLTAPMIVLRAGTELYSEPVEMHKLCEEAKDCTEFLFETSKHEVVNDSDSTRDVALHAIIELFQNN